MSSSFSWFMDTTVLWNGWRTDTVGKYAGTIIALVAIMLVKEFLFHKRVEIARHGLSSGSGKDQPLMASSGAGSYGTTEANALVRTNNNNGGGLSRTWKLRLINAVLGAINLTLGYFVMLVVMTYNNGFFIAIILGGALAQFLFSVPWSAEEPTDGAVEVDCCEQ
jgi:copper transporter 1